MTRDEYNSVAFDMEAMHRRWMKRPSFAAVYDAPVDEYTALDCVSHKQTRCDTRDFCDTVASCRQPVSFTGAETSAQQCHSRGRA